ncbi:MAC/perforin domain-containing protein [Mucilaginibacter sp. McL0603]|uniref:MAC/perforin domain-containing protein n=1 Tax=Mucilaginibacter sp. McL0603 TaxID=3415670 RepID=UPI003CF73E00
MKNFFLLIPIITIAAFSCKKTDHSIVKSSSAIKIDTGVSITQTHIKTTISAADGSPDYSLLGFGYDVNGAYADSSSVRAKVIDVDAFLHDNPYRFDLSRATSGSDPIVYANDAEDFSSNLSSGLTETNGLKVFKGSITDYFTNADALSAKYFYSSISITIVMKRLALNIYPDLVKNYLTAAFKQDVATLSAEALVNKYGTHVLTSIEFGGNMQALYRAETSLTDRRKPAIEGLRFAVKRIFGFSTGQLDPVDSTILASVHSPAIAYHVVGGDLSKFQVVKYPKFTFLSAVDWAKTVTADNAAFMSFGNDPLLPLDQFISDPVKQAAVKSYIATFISANSVKVTD